VPVGLPMIGVSSTAGDHGDQDRARPRNDSVACWMLRAATVARDSAWHRQRSTDSCAAWISSALPDS
jgi:hypothetical protein